MKTTGAEHLSSQKKDWLGLSQSKLQTCGLAMQSADGTMEDEASGPIAQFKLAT